MKDILNDEGGSHTQKLKQIQSENKISHFTILQITALQYLKFENNIKTSLNVK